MNVFIDVSERTKNIYYVSVYLPNILSKPLGGVYQPNIQVCPTDRIPTHRGGYKKLAISSFERIFGEPDSQPSNNNSKGPKGSPPGPETSAWGSVSPDSWIVGFSSSCPVRSVSYLVNEIRNKTMFHVWERLL